MGNINGIGTYAANYSVQYSTKSNAIGAEKSDENQFGSVLTNRYEAERAEGFDRTKMGIKPQQKPSFVGRVFSQEELYKYVDSKVQSNRGNKKSLFDMLKNSCPEGTNATFKFAGESHTYNFYDFMKEIERRTEALNENDETLSINSKRNQAVKNETTAEENYIHARAVDTVGVIGKNAPNAVRQAWIEAADETGTNGVSVTMDGKHYHLPRMLVEHLNRTFWGGGSPEDILGNSVESAISVAQKVIYDIDNPLPGQPVRSNDVQQEVQKERAFYERFIEKLMNIGEL